MSKKLIKNKKRDAGESETATRRQMKTEGEMNIGARRVKNVKNLGENKKKKID